MILLAGRDSPRAPILQSFFGPFAANERAQFALMI